MFIPSFRFLFLLVVVSWAVPTPAWGQNKSDSSKPAPKLRTSSDIEGDLLRSRDRVEFNLGLLKKKFEKEPEKLAQMKLNYVTTWRDVNLFVEDLQQSIRDGKNPKASKVFAQRVERAQQSVDEFNTFADQSLYPPEQKPKFLPVLLTPLVTSLVESIFTKVNASLKESAAERKARREEMASALDKIKFREFDKVTP